MVDVRNILEGLRTQTSPPEGSSSNPFRLAHALGEPATEQEIRAAWPGGDVPDDVAALWTTCGEGTLFEDVDYGQWGLRFLSPGQSADRTASESARRPEQFRPGDIVLGEFLGDQDLLVRSLSPGGPGVVVALPLDRRVDWYEVAPDLATFLRRYIDAGGDKFWEADA